LEAKRILIKEFGWPDNFKKEEWGKERERIWWEIKNRYEAAEPSMESPTSPISREGFFTSLNWEFWTIIGLLCLFIFQIFII
jgi:hypothetical protein